MTARTNSNITYTNQRIEILNYLKDNYSHPTVEQVYEAVRKKLTHISKATVYQNLKFLSEKGLIGECNIKGVSRFEPNKDLHHHIICKNCGSIIDFESKELTEYALSIAKKYKKMQVDTTHTHFYGLCEKCKGKKQK